MNFIKILFWNTNQSRVRSGYRLLVGIFLYSLFSGGMAILLKQVSGLQFSSAAPLWFFIARTAGQLCSAFLSIWIAGRFLDRREFSDFGFNINKSWWIDLSFGFGLGVVLMTIIFVVEYSAGWITILDTYHLVNPDIPFIFPIIVFFILLIGVSFSEELLTRGFILKNMAEGFNFKSLGPKGAIIIAWIISSSIFGLAHLNNPNATWVSSANIMLAGILLGYGYVLTKELSIPFGIHLSWNFFQGNVFGFPVSGMKVPSDVVTIFKIEQTGPEIWTGGAFGPEAGLVGLIAMLLGMVLIGIWVRIRIKTKPEINVSLAKYS